MPTRHLCILVLLAILLCAVPGSAAVLDDLARDFAPLSGVVIRPAEGGFLIDRTAADGIDVGDLFSVVAPGEKVVHPVTGKDLGTLDRAKGFLQVTQIRPGYSFTRLVVGSAGEIRSGDVIRRYDHVPALFLDRTGKGKAFYDRIRASLSGLDWQFQELGGEGTPPAVPEKILLSFLLGPETLEVRAPNSPVRTYDLALGDGGNAPGFPRTVPGPAVPPPPAEAAVRTETGRRTPDGEYRVRGTLPDGTLTTAFAYDGNRLLLAATDGSRIEVFEIGETAALVAIGGEIPGGRIHALHWWRPSPGGVLLLAATLAVEENRAYSPAIGQTIAGRVFALRGRGLEPVGKELPYLLGTFDHDGDGIRETLLCQPFDRDIFFGTRVREVRLGGNGLEIVDPSILLPGTFPVQGALFADLTGDGRPETLFVRNRTLFVYEGTKLLYESSRQMGGSLSILTYDINPGAADRLFTTGAFEVAPSVVDLDGDGRMEAVAAAFEGSSVSVGGPDIRKSWLATLTYREGRFVRGSLGPELETPIQGLFANGQGVFVVTTESPSMIQPKTNSRLLFLPLAGASSR